MHARQILSGIGYQWARGKMIYGAQLGVGYSFNRMSINAAASGAFAAGGQPITYDIDNSWVVRPQVKAEYFFHRKASVRAQLGYTYTDPNVVIATPTETLTHEWRPHHMQFNVSVGFFPFQKIRKRPPIGAAFCVSREDRYFSVFFFELFLFRRTETRRRAQRFAIVVKRQARDVARIHAARGLRLEHHEHRTAGQALTKRKAAAASKTRVHEAFQHDVAIILRADPPPRKSLRRGGLRRAHINATSSFSNTALGAMPMCLRQTLPSLLMMNDAGMPQIGP